MRSITSSAVLFGSSLSILMSILGCGDGRPYRVPVSGRITIDGVPVAKGSVSLRAAHGRPAIGRLRDDGRFVLSTYEINDGCALGEYVVTVYAVEQVAADTLQWNVPKKYQNTETSGLTAQIAGATDDLDFALTWDGVKGPVLEKVEPSE